MLKSPSKDIPALGMPLWSSKPSSGTRKLGGSSSKVSRQVVRIQRECNSLCLLRWENAVEILRKCSDEGMS